MAFWDRLKSWAGGRTPPTIALASGATTINLPDNANTFLLNAAGTVTIATINSQQPILAGRTIMLIGLNGTAAVTLTNSAASTTKGQIDAGAADLTVDDTDVVVLVQYINGVWYEVSSVDN